MKIIKMVKCNLVSIVNEISLQFLIGALATILVLALNSIFVGTINGGYIQLYSGVTLASSLFVFICRLENRLDIYPDVIERREDENARYRAIWHDVAKLLTVWVLIALPWFFYWILANYLLSGFITG